MRRFSLRRTGIFPVAGVLALVACAGVGTAADLDARRQAFREAWPAAERGEWAPVAERRALLEDYVLWPDLEAAWLTAKLGSVADERVQEFLATWGHLSAARELRYRYALRLAADERWTDYLDLYRRHYAEAGAARLDCLAVQAAIGTDAFPAFASLARSLWLTGRSQVDECDPVFDYLRGAGHLDADLVEQRFDLAVAAREFRLARYLARSMDAAALERAERWIAAGDDPVGFLEEDAACSDAREHREQLLYALERVAWNEAGRAHALWRRTAASHDFLPAEAAKIARYIALSAAQQHRPEAFELLRELPEDARDERVRAWQVRAALLRQEWADALAAIADMPAEQQSAQEWRYWRAVALERTGRAGPARALFHELARERSWFGFLAADEIGLEYAFGHADAPRDAAVLAELGADPALVRARELFHVGLESRARSEWNEAVGRLDRERRVQAAVLAHEWNWHSQAIATLAEGGVYDDLAIRYPLAFVEAFAEAASTAGIRRSWAWAVARSESLFMADVRSHAGAIGIMQLMPGTGKRTAAEIGLPWAGLATLTDPESNIRLGTTYLAKMLERFGGNLVLATAAYNAGPNKVDEWLGRTPQDALDARIWIENIPYDETRAFVRRVLVADAIFHWRLTGEAARLSAALRAVGPPPQQVSHAAPGPVGAD